MEVITIRPIMLDTVKHTGNKTNHEALMSIHFIVTNFDTIENGEQHTEQVIETQLGYFTDSSTAQKLADELNKKHIDQLIENDGGDYGSQDDFLDTLSEDERPNVEEHHTVVTLEPNRLELIRTA